ncbi:LamG domain-containing protein [Lacibacter sediminis]|uniref:LamG domain-containing protein n=1 Tax=Lacibacter sediminis TaxID=2760713 RepID=A0A7G5XIH6_9BACT|nr:LamG domain-containing protein [Lacibacter sediminis]QNA45279.1 LamG domain-containing protein [Lacibacter sediminis]
MKKHILIFATIATTVFISCSKEKLQTTQPDVSIETKMTSSSQRQGEETPLTTLGNGLLGLFTFNGTLSDATNQLTATSTVGRVIYTADRKGVVNQAIKFNGNYGLDIPNVPLATNMSISVWVKTDMYTLENLPFVNSPQSFSLSQMGNKYQMGYWNGINGQYVVSGNVGSKWHHIAATRSDKALSFYIDGKLIGSSPSPVGSGPYSLVSEYLVGYGYNNGYQYWEGSLDDLRIYNRVLSSTELLNLAKF